MNKKPTYQEQFNKLTEAYISNKVDPYYGCGCFVGNLLNGKGNWELGREMLIWHRSKEYGYQISPKGLHHTLLVLQEECDSLYTPREIFELEKKFLRCYNSLKDQDGEEEALFKAFETTLDLLKEIHISKGEIIDTIPVFTKRQLIHQ